MGRVILELGGMYGKYRYIGGKNDPCQIRHFLLRESAARPSFSKKNKRNGERLHTTAFLGDE